jgi:hypothetical protein
VSLFVKKQLCKVRRKCNFRDLAQGKTGGHETRWSQIYHCLYCYFTGHFSIILNGFSFNHLLLFLLLTDVNEGFCKTGVKMAGHRATLTTASEAEYNDEPYNKPP